VDLTSLAAAAQYSAVGLLVALACLAVWAFYTGKVHSHREFAKQEEEAATWRKAWEAERTRADELARAGTVTNQLIGALTQVAAERGQAREPAP
jgi:hypothetical protein